MSAGPFIPLHSDEEIAATGLGVLELSLPKPRWTHAARSFLLQNPARSLFETCNALMTSPLGKSDWLLA
jgi:hypothetical protein